MTAPFDVSDLSKKLDTLIRLQAALAVSQYESQKEKIIFLNGAGLPPKDIADILGTTSNTVSVAISNYKKAAMKKDTK
jgi:DNA-binding CsgD family transcriptional regulator